MAKLSHFERLLCHGIEGERFDFFCDEDGELCVEVVGPLRTTGVLLSEFVEEGSLSVVAGDTYRAVAEPGDDGLRSMTLTVPEPALEETRRLILAVASGVPAVDAVSAWEAPEVYSYTDGHGDTHRLSLILERCRNGRLALTAESDIGDGCCKTYATFTVDLDARHEDDCAFIDTKNLGDGILGWLSDNGVAEPTGRVEASGGCEYPEVRFTYGFLEGALAG